MCSRSKYMVKLALEKKENKETQPCYTVLNPVTLDSAETSKNKDVIAVTDTSDNKSFDDSTDHGIPIFTLQRTLVAYTNERASNKSDLNSIPHTSKLDLNPSTSADRPDLRPSTSADRPDLRPSTSADRPDLRPLTSLNLSDSDSEIIADNTDFSYSPSNSSSDDISSGNEEENGEPMSTTTTSQKLTRKRKKDPSTWKRNFQKNLRLDGKQYYTQTGKLKPAKEVKNNITCHCHYNCSRHFSTEERCKIFERFTNLRTQQLRWNFIAKQVSCIPKKRCYSANTDRRANTYVYRLTSDQISYQVCQKFFLATINVSSKTVKTALSKQCDSGIVQPDMRGKKIPPQKKSEQVKNIIRDHIKSIPVVSSHYCRSTTKRKYLPQGLSETRLYEDYKCYCEELNVVPEKFSYYRQIFVTEFNLGFFRPKKDQCDFCTKFEGLDNEGKLSLQEQYNDHIKRKRESRDHKQSDKERSKTDNTFVCYTMDMEKILITPSLNVGKLYYTQKLKTYNFTVYDLSNSEATNYMWHEGIGAKGSSEIATCLWKHISTLEPSVKEVTFYSDTAAGQNRNIINAAMFLKAVSMLPIDIINQKYMESTYVYRLTSDQISYQVCQKFFLATINVSSKTVKTALSKQCDSGIVQPDMRGKKIPPQKKSEQVKNIIRDHIKSIPVVSSHYCRSTTKRKYLPQGLSETRLYEDYKCYCEELNVVPEKFSYYRQIFVTEFNLGFFRPKKDQCDFCTKFEGLDNEGKLSLQEQYNDHIKRKRESRDHKQSDKERSKTDNTFVCYTMDMEKILITPSLNVGKLYYTQKLKTYNFTVYDLSNSEATNYMWHEGIGAKGSSEIATCLWKHISTLEPSVKEVTFYSDTAAGQNRNIINAAMFLKAVSMLPIDIINQKYMESGHSEMECDSVHSAIETRGTKIDIYTPEGWYTVVRSAKIKKPFYKVVELNFTDFLNYKYFSTLVIKNRNKNEAGETVSWLKIKWLQYRKEDPTRIFYKDRLDQDFKSILVKKVATRMKSSLTDDIQALYTGPLPIEKRKLDGLVKLCDSKCIPETYHTFYKSLRSVNEIPADSSDEEVDS